MKLQRSSKAAAVLVGGLGVALMTGGTAYAYWSTSGSGAGAADAGASSPLLVTQTAKATGLFPTGSSTGTIGVKNDNAFAVELKTATFGATSDGNEAGCSENTVTFTAAVPATAAERRIAPGATLTLTYTAAMSNLAEDACQNTAASPTSFSALMTATAESVQ